MGGTVSRERVPRLVLTAGEAPAALGVSHDFLAEHIAAETALPVEASNE